MQHKTTTFLIAAVLCLGLVALAAGAAVAQPPSGAGKPTDERTREPGGPSNKTQGPDAKENRTDNRSDNKPTALPQAGPKAGRLAVGNGSIDGRYVDATYDEAAGTITGYTVNGVEYFASVQAPGNFTAKGRGGHVQFAGDGFLIAVTDNPNGLLRVHASNLSVDLTLAEGVSGQANGSHVRITAGNETGIATNGTLSGQTLSLEKGSFHLHGKSVSASAKSYSESRIEEAIARGKVAARVQVLEDGTDVLDFEGARVEPRETANGSHRFVIDANFTSGRAFVVDFAPGLLQAEHLEVLYYDEINGTLEPAAITRADSLEDVLQLDAGEGPEFWHVKDGAGAQVIVAVPHFSVHAFDVYAVSAKVPPTVLIGIAAAAILVAVVAVGAFRGRTE